MNAHNVINVHKKELVVAAFLSVFFFVLGLTRVLPLPSMESRSLFSGYFTLVVRYTPELEKLITVLKTQENIETVISYETALVSFTDFDGLETTPLSKLNARFDPEDPRLDPYVKGLAAYFIQKAGEDEWRILYVRTHLDAGALSALLTRLFKHAHAEWYLNEKNPRSFTVPFMIFNMLFVFMLLLLHRSTGYKLLVLGGLLPWMFSAALGTVVYFLLYLAIGVYWSFLVIEFIPLCKQYVAYRWLDKDNRNILLQGMLWGTLIVIYLFVKLYGAEPAGEVLLSTGSDILLLGCYTGLLLLKRRITRPCAYGHELFQPVTIVRGFQDKWYHLPGRTPVLIALCCLFLTAPFLFLITGYNIRLPLPTPVHLSHTAINLKTMREAARAKQGDMLPDLTDYIKHIAFQQELEYGKPAYSFPGTDEKILISTYEKTAGLPGITKSEHVLKRFDDEWCNAVLAEVPVSSIEKILLEQGSLVGVTLQTPKILGLDLRQLWTIILLWCIFLCPLLLFNFFFTPRKVYGIKIPLTAKSKEY